MKLHAHCSKQGEEGRKWKMHRERGGKRGGMWAEGREGGGEVEGGGTVREKRAKEDTEISNEKWRRMKT